jgi:hypothetical protein
MSVKLGKGVGRLAGMVLIADIEGKGKWIDYESDHTTLEGLTERLREGCDARRWFAWRVILIESEGGPVTPWANRMKGRR